MDSQNAPQKMPDAMRTFLQENNLFPSSVNPSAATYTKAEWMLIETSLESYQFAMAQATQQQMVYIQDYMGQYNQYMQGVSGSQIASRSQTMLGGHQRRNDGYLPFGGRGGRRSGYTVGNPEA